MQDKKQKELNQKSRDKKTMVLGVSMNLLIPILLVLIFLGFMYLTDVSVKSALIYTGVAAIALYLFNKFLP